MTLTRPWSAAARFSATLSLWAICAVLGLIYTLAIVARLDVSFFEANGMIVNPELREAFYYQVFDMDPVNVGILFMGLVGVVSTSYIFARSQVNYFKRLDRILTTFASSGEIQNTMNMGNFTPYLTLWMQMMYRRYKGESLKSLRSEIEKITRLWPASPKVSWSDQSQFAIGAGVLALLFASFCLSVFMRVNESVVDLSRKLVRFQNPAGPQFLTEQIAIVNFVGLTLLGFMCAAFIVTGYRYGKLMGESSYSVLRDMRRFLEGNSSQRLFLRRNDLGREYIPTLNQSLDKIASKIREE